MAKNAAPTAKENGGQGDKKELEAAGSASKPDLTSATASTSNREDTSSQDGLPPTGMTDSALPGTPDEPTVYATGGMVPADDYIDSRPFAMVRNQITHIEVTAHQDGFRRAGLVWSRQPSMIPLSELSDEQKLQLQGEKNLRIRPARDPEGDQE